MSFEPQLTAELSALAERGLERRLLQIDSPQAPHVCLGGRQLLNFSSNDYLGLANHPLVKEAALEAVAKYGAGAGASRLISGSLTPHARLDEALAAFKGTKAALSFSSGYAAALGTICALLSKDDIIILDRLVHACIVDAARLSGARIRVFAHNDLGTLERILVWARARTAGSPSAALIRPRRILVVTESVFSMDGDHAPLRDIAELKDRHGAWLMVDEAHATGLYGPCRRGWAEAQGVSDRIEIQMGTLGKALGAAGGFICGARELIDLLINRARSFVFSTAPVPAAAAAATAAIRFVQDRPGEVSRKQLWDRVEQLRAALVSAHSAHLAPPGDGPRPVNSGSLLDSLTAQPSAIIPLVVGSEARALEAAAALRERGVFVPAIRYPTVARGQARLRLTMTASHTPEDIAQVVAALRDSVEL